MKATHFKVRYEGEYSGRPYAYEETVPVTEYQCKNAFWLNRMAREKRDIVERMNDADEGFHWVWVDGNERMTVEGICLSGH